jgi:hypothetical protein
MKIFLALFGGQPDLMDKAATQLAQDFKQGYLGLIDFQSPDLPFTDTEYYRKEMGPGLFKRYLSFSQAMGPENLVELKLAAMALENQLSGSTGRQVNLDPGYVFAGGLVLSTGKFSGHRLYLGQGVWGELTLHYHRGAFRALPWTYQDYLKPEVLSIIGQMRRHHMLEQKSL